MNHKSQLKNFEKYTPTYLIHTLQQNNKKNICLSGTEIRYGNNLAPTETKF